MHTDLSARVRVALFFKDFAHYTAASCVGLAVAGYTSAAYLRRLGLDATAYAVRHNVDIVRAIDRYNETHARRLTHVVISAPWLDVHDLTRLVEHFQEIQFIILSHSNVGFLQADPWGLALYRRYAELSRTHGNLNIGGNCRGFTDWFQAVYGVDCVCLPNLYPAGEGVRSKVWPGGPLKIGAFGAIRPEKNFMCAAAAATLMQKRLNVPVELHMSSGGEHCQSTTLDAISQMVENLPDFKLIRHHWEIWDKFIGRVAAMDVLLQVSYTESFNMITADGISRGVPVVVSPVINWAPASWKADPDDVTDIAQTGCRLLQEDQGGLGSAALQTHNERGVRNWLDYLAQKLS